MLTDSRSFLSIRVTNTSAVRCATCVGNDVENGKIPASEIDRVNQMVEDICYNNAKNYFQFSKADVPLFHHRLLGFSQIIPPSSEKESVSICVIGGVFYDAGWSPAKNPHDLVFYPPIFHYICHAIDKTAHDLSDDPVEAEENPPSPNSEKECTDIDYMIEHVAADLIRLLVEKRGMTFVDAVDKLYTSDTYASCPNPKTGVLFKAPSTFTPIWSTNWLPVSWDNLGSRLYKMLSSV